MPQSILTAPTFDPTPIFEAFRGSYSTEFLSAAIGHFNLFAPLTAAPLSFDELRGRLGLDQRPANVLITALRAMNLLALEDKGNLDLTPLAREHLTPGGPFDVSDYVALSANNPAVLAMVERLRTNRPAGAKPGGPGASFIYREGLESAIESQANARRLTPALPRRAK